MPERGTAETFSAVIPDELERTVDRVLRRAVDLDVSIATAESCTGGLLASLLTDVPGASGVFERGFVVYSEPSKCELLGLASADLDRCGAVSEEVAIAMAEGALERSKADLAISITGYADDGPEPGLVHLACATEWAATLHRRVCFGAIGRGPVRVGSMEVALELIDAALDARPATELDDGQRGETRRPSSMT